MANSETSLIVPIFIISVHSSSFNYRFSTLPLLRFPFLFIDIHKAGWNAKKKMERVKSREKDQNRENYMNCRKQNDKIRSIRLATGLYLHMSTLKWNSGNSAPRWYGLSQVTMNLWLSLDQLIISITKLKIALIHNV